MVRTSKWFALLSCLLIVLGPAAPGQPETPKAKKYALLVGIREYSSSVLPELQFTENDVEELAKLLRSPRMNFTEVRILSTSRGADDPKAKPTAANVRAALKELLRGKGRHDTVLIALAGHGVQLEVDDPDGKGKMQTFPFFCPLDADLKDRVGYKSGHAASMVNVNDLFTDLAECGAGTKLVFIDACRNEVRTRNVAVDQVTIPRGVAALFSCGPGQRAFETAKLGKGHGVFFHYVLEGLRGKASTTQTTRSLGTP